MPTFTFEPSPPSTPGSGQQSRSSLNFGEHPSTTPLGPPPSSAKSFTPAGAPPPSIFGSSQLGTAQSLFSAKFRNKRIEPEPSNGQKGAASILESKSYTTKIPLNDVAQDEEFEADAEGEEDDMELDFGNGYGQEFSGAASRTNLNSSGLYDWAAHGSSTRSTKSKGNLTRSIGGLKQSLAGSTPARSAGSLLRTEDFTLSTIARDVVKQSGKTELSEPDELILETEAQVSKLYQNAAPSERYDEQLPTSLAVVPEALRKIWQTCANELPHSNDEDRGDTIGPVDEDPALYKASFVGGLLLTLHHPPVNYNEMAVGTRSGRRSQLALVAPRISSQEAYPKTLIDWLDVNHNPYRNVLTKFLSLRPNPTANRNYWDILLSAAVRGQLGVVRKVLEISDFRYARTEDDGPATKAYQGPDLENSQYVIGQAVKTLDQCPGLHEGNWHITGPDWILFRKIVEESIEKLTSFAEGGNRGHSLGQSTFEVENFGRSSTPTMTQSSRRAQSKIPWTVYDNLKRLYHILLGNTAELLNMAQDWLEATLALTIWWDGNEDFGRTSKSSFRQSRRSRVPPQRAVDNTPVAAYRKRVINAFEAVKAEDVLQIQSNDPMEVVIALVIDGYIQDSLSILRTWSVPITAALMEVGTKAGWYESYYEEQGMDGLDESDLMVLSYAQPERPISRDSVLLEYAEMVFERHNLRNEKREVEGWEMSIELLGRVENQKLSAKEVARYLKCVDVQSDQKADKLISICHEYDLHKEASEIAEKYGDLIAESTDRYGTALTYYAQAHNTRKVKDVLDLLISFCLVQSTSYPPVEKLDSHLSSLLLEARTTLTNLAVIDSVAAEILSTQLSGYATVRKFYDLRDQALRNKNTNESKHSLHARRRAAASALLTVIASAADNIQGGLFDIENPSVVPVDGLLVLLGEATVFVDKDPRILTLQDLLVLLRAVEDLSAIHPRIMAQCAECLSSALASAHGAPAPDPRDLMKKSISDLTASTNFSMSTGFSLLGNSMTASSSGAPGASSYAAVAASGTSAASRGEKSHKRKRGWDWRQDVPRDCSPGRLLKRLRLGLAKEVGKAWIQGEEV